MLSVTWTGVRLVILVVFVVRENRTPDVAGADAGPAAGAAEGACVVRLGAARAVAASKLISNHTNDMLPAGGVAKLYRAAVL